MFFSWMRTVDFGNSAVTAAAEPSLESLSTTTTSIGTSALASSACSDWRRRSLTLELTMSAETIGLGASGIAGELSTPGAWRRLKYNLPDCADRRQIGPPGAPGPTQQEPVDPAERDPLHRRSGRGHRWFRVPRHRRPHPRPGDLRAGGLPHRALCGWHRAGADSHRRPRPIHGHADRPRRCRRALSARANHSPGRDPLPARRAGHDPDGTPGSRLRAPRLADPGAHPRLLDCAHLAGRDPPRNPAGTAEVHVAFTEPFVRAGRAYGTRVHPSQG